ncbi:pyridoxamine 5'-phosphate oxidase family protein [Rhodococcus sp. X156]|uniref:pyridoxamine 5'-phosphate oxidase family protein n=1 Tax=Rhodococcus sp. X156 TaxID=2499145 RepID=UPI000FD84309|nr:pyridoxamine 5'-phosphate oxidase family protein [Rhodococcus sp. X156]
MSAPERDAFLAEQRTCRMATVSADGAPHVSPLWFIWDGEALWMQSITRSKRWANLARDPRVAVVVDDGHDYLELRGVELHGSVEVVGEVPRTGAPDEVLVPMERSFAQKYFGLDELPHDGKHAWHRLVPTKIVSWDFRKLAELGR